MILYYFGNEEMVVGEGGHLRHVGDRDDLMALAEVGHLFADGAGDFASDIGIDLVEDHERDLVLIGEGTFHGEHDP